MIGAGERGSGAFARGAGGGRKGEARAEEGDIGEEGVVGVLRGREGRGRVEGQDLIALQGKGGADGGLVGGLIGDGEPLGEGPALVGVGAGDDGDARALAGTPPVAGGLGEVARADHRAGVGGPPAVRWRCRGLSRTLLCTCTLRPGVVDVLPYDAAAVYAQVIRPNVEARAAYPLDPIGNVRKTLEYLPPNAGLVALAAYGAWLLGRRRFIPFALDSRRNIQEMGFRQAINMRIQGAAADIIKIAMIRIHNALKNGRLQTRMVLQIHDELLFDAPEREVEQVCELVRTEMENAFKLDVPLVVDIGAGANWAVIH